MQQEYIGFNSRDVLDDVLNRYSAQNIFLVYEQVSFRQSGAKEFCDSVLRGRNVTPFCNFRMNPKIEDLHRGIEIFNRADPDAVVAIGGGSVIDMAKMIRFFAAAHTDPDNYLRDTRINSQNPMLFVAIPTTAGTGSEATHFAVLYVGGVKHSVAHETITPDIAIVDPAFTMSMPAAVTAATGMDALSQAIESYWCINSNEESKNYAQEAITLAINSLVTAVNKPDGPSRLAMACAAHLAGKAINITKTTAPHAVSYPITSLYGIPHGHAVALTLPAFLIFNYEVTPEDVSDSRGSNYVKNTVLEIANLLGQSTAPDAAQMLDNLMADIGLPNRLSQLGIDSCNDIQNIIENGFDPERVRNNPRLVTPQALKTILIAIR